MPGDVVPLESEVLYLSKLTGWLPQDIEAMDYVYYANLSAAWGIVAKAQGKGRTGAGDA